MPNIVPSMAADTVPEYVMSSPRLPPLFIPDAMRAGGFSSSLLTPITTQSVGVPFSEYMFSDILFIISGLRSVSEWLVALISLSGAIMTALATWFIAS
ncbi:hypothetical protein MCHI_001834 [Candidatus Magnetoovum chiemensis]|nr:hypothetical protein MCHI_001834 [Candidatus Magnetoovum chiemensis]